ncbi:MAG: cytochrome c [Anaerolineae bacterium]
MSQHYTADPLNANLVAVILIVAFIISGGIILASTGSTLLQPDAEQVVEVALAEVTATPAPTSSPVPPTATPIPTIATTATPAPTNTPQQATADTGAAAPRTSGNTAVNYDPALVAQGQQLFTLCSACHGPDAKGLPKLGKNLVESEFVHSLSDEELLTFVKTGRPLWDALNTTGIDMPPKGGNPALTDDEIRAIIAYVRTLGADAS